ncbi:hypothetical protein niasHS_014670 [Heterodera schachtii]|uniref:Uncharacterized protein n=1 Tax=Heterodera schachtii TaxID=97005 RepID=A0ABD2IZV9_HETSC
MSQNESLDNAQQKSEQQQKQQQNPNTEAELALQQAQVGLNLFWLIQQAAAMQQQQQQQVEEGQGTAPTSSLTERQNVSLHSALSNLVGFAKASSPPNCPSPFLLSTQQQANGISTLNDEKRRRDLSIIGRRWEYVSDVQSFVEFEQLRCRHQVSRNRTFAHGIRYSCTQKTQLRSNCPYLLLCLFSDGAGEHSAPGVGTISVYSRNKHTHPVKVIKARQPRRFAKLAKREKKWDKKEEEEEEQRNGKRKGGKEIGEPKEKEEDEEKGGEAKEEAEMGGTAGEALIEILSKMLAEQQKDGEGAKYE